MPPRPAGTVQFRVRAAKGIRLYTSIPPVPTDPLRTMEKQATGSPMLRFHPIANAQAAEAYYAKTDAGYYLAGDGLRSE